MAKNGGTDLDDVRSGRSDKPKISDKINIFKFPEKKWVTFRIFGKVYSYGGYWVKTVNKEKKAAKFYTECPSFDPATQMRDSTKYDPWRDFQESEASLERDDKKVQFTQHFYMNAIHRASEKNKPGKVPRHTSEETESGFKDKDSDSWTPMVTLKLPSGAVNKLKEQAGLNVRKVKGQTQSFAITHVKFGCDVRIMYDSTKAAADMYQVSIGEPTPITEEEAAYLAWDLSDLVQVPSDAEVKRDFESWATRNGIKLKAKKAKVVEDDDEFDDEDEAPKKKSSAKGKKKPVDEDEDMSDFDEDDEDEDEDEAPKKKPSKKSKVVDDEGDDFDDDEDEAPKKKPAKKAKVVDEDDDFDDEDEAPKKKSSAKGKKKVVDEDDDDLEDDLDDEDADETPKKKAPAKGKKKPVDEDDDFDEDDEEETPKKKPAKKSKVVDDEEDDFEDEDEAPKKKAPAKGKKKVVDDDDEDFDDEEDEAPKKSKKPVKRKPVDDDEDDDFDE